MQQDGTAMDRRVRPKRWRTGLLQFLLIVLAAGVCGWIFYPTIERWASAGRSLELARLRTGQVTRGDLLRDLSVQGRIVAADRPTLVSPAQGVVSILVKAGDPVSRGDELASIQSPELENRLAQERSTQESMTSDFARLEISNQQAHLQDQQEVALLEVKLRASERALVRARDLFNAGLGNAIDHQKAQDDVEVAGLELAHAREKTRLNKERMDFELQTKQMELRRQHLVVDDLARKVLELAVLSPVDGQVSRVDARDKDTVQPNQSLLGVVDLSKFEVEILIPETYADEIEIGTPGEVRYENKDFRAEVRSLSPEVENSQVKGIVQFAGTPPAGLKQNQRVSTRLLLESRTGVLKVSRGPFLESMGGRQVYLIEDGVATLSPVTVGAVSVTEVEILSGLAEGQEIILSDLARFEGVERILLR